MSSQPARRLLASQRSGRQRDTRTHHNRLVAKVGEGAQLSDSWRLRRIVKTAVVVMVGGELARRSGAPLRQANA